MMIPAHREQGFTLIEVMISLGLFALIAVAGLGLVDSVLNVQGRTEARLDRLADMRRAMFIVGSDLDQIARGEISGDAGGVSFTRAAPGLGGVPAPVRYTLAGGVLLRIAGANPQQVLTGVEGARWRFYADGAWHAAWPLGDDTRNDRPEAVALDMRTDRGTLSRVVALPATPSGGV